ncbi:MAG: helix-turn-helix domain-containing protein [Planctomycetota bacterium]
MQIPPQYVSDHLPLYLCMERLGVVIEGEFRSLTRQQILAIRLMIKQPGRVVSFEEFRDLIGNDGGELSRSALKQLMFRTRQRLAPFGDLIQTARGSGYLLDPQATMATAEAE